jgi:DNA-binding NtrC family response regulator
MQENAATSVLITGESGTGKELIARAIHYGGARAAGPFEPVNCAAVPSELIESLFFGHVRGAFTGADSDRMGHFQMAHEGTLFLDEIGDMPLELQATLLRVLEDGEVRRIGEAKGTRVDVRVVAATNADLQERIQSGKFRQDLYYRLAQFTVPAPPLRQRKEDIPLLARHFVQLCAREMGMEAPVLSPQVLEVLAAYEFPGNVRELKNTIGKALIESGGGEIRSYHLDCYPEVAPGESVVSSAPSADVAANVPLNLDQAELWVIKRALGQTGGNISEAARLLGTNRNRIYRVLAEEKERTGR